MQQRTERVAQLLQREITSILLQKVRDANLKDVSVSHVKVTKDLKLAKIYFRHYSSVDVKQIEKSLNKAKGFFKTELSQRLDLRVIPDLKFYYDEFLDCRDKMDQLFEKNQTLKTSEHFPSLILVLVRDPQFQPPEDMNRFLSDGSTILIDKPARLTSFSVVRRVRAATGIKKIGHCGTLDPLATGLLILCTGRATKAISSITDSDKTYEGAIQLGTRTDTDDIEGQILGKAACANYGQGRARFDRSAELQRADQPSAATILSCKSGGCQILQNGETRCFGSTGASTSNDPQY